MLRAYIAYYSYYILCERLRLELLPVRPLCDVMQLEYRHSKFTTTVFMLPSGWRSSAFSPHANWTPIQQPNLTFLLTTYSLYIIYINNNSVNYRSVFSSRHTQLFCDVCELSLQLSSFGAFLHLLYRWLSSKPLTTHLYSPFKKAKQKFSYKLRVSLSRLCFMIYISASMSSIVWLWSLIFSL